MLPERRLTWLPKLHGREKRIKIGPASDIYLLGGILYQIVTGLTPHKGTNVVDCIRKAMRNDIQKTDKKRRTGGHRFEIHVHRS